MAVTTDAFEASDLAAIIPEIWSPIVLEELFAKTVAANFFTDLSPFMTAGGDTVHVPDAFTNTYTVRTQSTQGAEITTESQALVDVTVAVDTHKYIALLIGDKDMQQIARGTYDINAIHARKIGSTLRDDLEDAIFALWSGLSSNSVGDTATVLSDLEIRQSIEDLASGNFPLNELAWFFHPTVLWHQVFGIQKFYDSSQSGWTGDQTLVRGGALGNASPERGLRGMLYGIPVFESTNVVSGFQTYRNLLAHPTAFGFALQTPGGSRVRLRSEARLENLGALTVADMIYGVGELRDDAAVVVNANTTATQS